MKMKKYIILFLCVGLLSACSNDKKVSGEPNIAGAYQEMNKASFWIDRAKDVDKTMMSIEEIEQFNKEILNTKETDCVDLNTYP